MVSAPLERGNERLVAGAARLLNIGLRFGTLLTRFLFVFFLARYIDPTSVGYYGLFTATVSYGLYMVGLDFYVFLSREILQVSDEQRGAMLKGQLTLCGLLYVIVLPAFVLILMLEGWSTSLLCWFVPILALEHFNQEVSRLLVVLSDQVAASITLFVRQGSWAIAVVTLMIGFPESRNLNVIMALWACAGLAAGALGIWRLRQLPIGGWSKPIDWRWVGKGISVSAAFLVSTLALRGIQTADRYWMESLGGIEAVGAYVLFLGVAGTLMVFLDAGVFSFSYPALISHSHKQEYSLARKTVQQMFFQTVAMSVAFGLVSWTLLPYLLQWVGKAVYQDAVGLYPWVLLAAITNAVGMVPHYALYARGFDKPIIYSHIAALPVFVISTWCLSKSHSELAVPISMTISFTLIMIWKAVAYHRLDTNHLPPKSSA
ncbi:lipopolysaccharide biosynthesis protein [Mesorhizobium kowhaii]|uniref:lipopolysaccharide biosynthesis protein n=1 Tax=Mesorhizobium kowhaii TaxID=1300272 RepID=UPI0035EDE3C3